MPPMPVVPNGVQKWIHRGIAQESPFREGRVGATPPIGPLCYTRTRDFQPVQ